MSVGKNLPSVVARLKAHNVALGRPMLGVRMIGDSRFDHAGDGDIADPASRRAVQYATEMLRKAGQLGDDLSCVDAIFEPPATVIFIGADKRQEVLARFSVPDRVMNYDPSRVLLSYDREPERK